MNAVLMQRSGRLGADGGFIPFGFLPVVGFEKSSNVGFRGDLDIISNLVDVVAIEFCEDALEFEGWLGSLGRWSCWPI